jgi:PIN domain nuclease of toxin-antitoxin system
VKLLLDSHFIVAIVDLKLNERFPVFARFALAEKPRMFVSIASLWELSIKSQLNKLNLRVRPVDLPSFFEDIAVELLAIKPEHVTATLQPNVSTRDPFDRLLLAQAQIEDMRLVTADRALAGHPAVWS